MPVPATSVAPLDDQSRHCTAYKQLTDASSRAFVRFFYSGASKSRLDAQSRVSVPGPLRGFADLDTDVVVAGAPGRLELWSPARWDAAIQAVQENPPHPELLANFIA